MLFIDINQNLAVPPMKDEGRWLTSQTFACMHIPISEKWHISGVSHILLWKLT